MRYYLKVWILEVLDRGTPQECRRLAASPEISGPFDTRASAEAFASAQAVQVPVGKIAIVTDFEVSNLEHIERMRGRRR